MSIAAADTKSSPTAPATAATGTAPTAGTAPTTITITTAATTTSSSAGGAAAPVPPVPAAIKLTPPKPTLESIRATRGVPFTPNHALLNSYVNTSATALPALARDVSNSGLLQPIGPIGAGGELRQSVIGLERGVNSTLARLDEFSALIESMRTSSRRSCSELLPRVISRAVHLQQIFARIDRLSNFMAVLERSIERMENRFESVESQCVVSTGVSKLFSSFMSSILTGNDQHSKATPLSSSQAANVNWQPIDFIVPTAQYFNTAPNSNSNSTAAAGGGGGGAASTPNAPPQPVTAAS